MPRINQVSAVLGRRGTGKTTYIKDLILQYQKKHPEMKILILDTLDHPAYRHVPAIDLDQLKRWRRPNTYRIYGSNTDEILKVISENLTNALIICEDASKYLNRSINTDVRAFLYDSKQKNLDIIFLFHGFMACPVELFRIIDNLVLFKCDHPETRKREMINYPEILEAYNNVMKDKNPFAKLTVKIY